MARWRSYTPSISLGAMCGLVLILASAACTSPPSSVATTPPSVGMPGTQDVARHVALISFTARDGRVIPAAVSTPVGKGPFPVVVTIHGGSGDRTADVLEGLASPGSDSPVVRMLNEQPWIIVAPDYRNDWLGAERLDVVDAIEGARTLPGADRDRVAIVGGSNGGRLALMASILSSRSSQCVIAGSPFMTDPLIFMNGEAGLAPFSQATPASLSWMMQTRARMDRPVERSARRQGLTRDEMLRENVIRDHAGKIEARVLLLTSRADEQVPHIMLEGLISALQQDERKGHQILIVEDSLHGFYWGRDGEFGARAGRGPRTPRQHAEEDAVREAMKQFLTGCLADP